ncbi:addiction module protein [Zavarzinella formosa]|uniref:addiction module protein n=1 Tax=Zavarzinella formosa TaxID=360055 RepID=UPI0002EB0413|nr:addiction module protein [Zavarzinella formosa]
MPDTVDDLYQAVIVLSKDDQIKLAGRLLDNVREVESSTLHPAWAEELSRRSAQIDAGEVQLVPWEEVRRRAWESIRQKQSEIGNG